MIISNDKIFLRSGRLILSLILLVLALPVLAGLDQFKALYFPKEYICRECKMVPKDPVQLQCQNHEQPVYCTDCIKDNLIASAEGEGSFATCPLCSPPSRCVASNIGDRLADIITHCKACNDYDATYAGHKDCTVITHPTKPSSDYIKQICTFSNTGNNDEILPLLINPPSWQDVYAHLHKYLGNESHYRAKREILRYALNLNITQFPVAETIEGIYRVVYAIYEHYRHQYPGSPLIIAAVGSGKGAFERALYERLRRDQGQDAQNDIISTDNITEIAPDLFIHCSDLYPDHRDKRFRKGESLLPCSESMDYRKVPDFLLERHPNAKILFFQSWMPMTWDKEKDNWIPHLLAHSAALGYVHIGNPETCGLGSSYCLLTPKEYVRKEGFVFAPAGIDGPHFKSKEYSLLGWGFEDGVMGGNFLTRHQLHLTTKLTLFYPPHYPIDALDMGDLEYDDEFLKKRFKPFCKTQGPRAKDEHVLADDSLK